MTDLLARHQRSPMEQRLFTRVFKLEKGPRLSPGERMLDLILDAGREALAGRQADMVSTGRPPYSYNPSASTATNSSPRFADGSASLAFRYLHLHIACTSVLRAADLAYRFLTRPNATDDDAASSCLERD